MTSSPSTRIMHTPFATQSVCESIPLPAKSRRANNLHKTALGSCVLSFGVYSYYQLIIKLEGWIYEHCP